MNSHAEDQLVREAFAAARVATPTPEEVDAVLHAVSDASPLAKRIWRSRAAKAIAAVILASGLLAVSPVGARVLDLGGTFAGYFSDDGVSGDPGTAVSEQSDAPPWLDDQRGERLLAENAGHSLYVARQQDGEITFSLDKNATVTDSVSGWESQFEGNQIVTFGLVAASIDDTGADVLPLYGVSAAGVATVEVRYADGSSTVAGAGSGGFVVPIQPRRDPVSLVGLDAGGAELQTIDLTEFEFPP